MDFGKNPPKRPNKRTNRCEIRWTRRLSVTLDNADNTPATLTLVNADGDMLAMDVTAPAAGWQAGSNR